MADIKPIKPIKLCVNITIPTIDDDSISLYECVGILGNKLQEAIQKINESLGSLEGAYTADNPPPYPVTSVNGKTGAVVIDIPANVYTEDNPPPYPVTSVNRAETKDVITVFEPEGGSIEDVSQAELIAACKAGARLGAFNQDDGTCRLYHFNLYVDPERVDYKEVAGGSASGVISVNEQTGAVNIFNAPISAATAESVTVLNESTNTKINQLKNDINNKTRINYLRPVLQTQTINGVTCTNNGDGTYTLNGTSSSEAVFSILCDLSIKGPFKLLGLDRPASECGVYINIWATDAYLPNYVDSIYGCINSTDKVINSVQIHAQNGTSLNNLVIKPMLTDDLSATYDDFVSYDDSLVKGHDVIDKSSIGDAWASGKTYAVGNYCINDNRLYKCKTAHTAGSAFDAAYWNATSVAAELAKIINALNISI